MIPASLVAWLASNKGILKGAAFVLALVLLMVAVAWLKGREEADDRSNQQVGAAVQREADQAETIERTEKANVAAETVRTDDAAARAECLRHARNPKDC